MARKSWSFCPRFVRTDADATCSEVPRDIVDAILLVDDGSDDGTIEIASRMGVESFLHINNLGYAANQKTCYREALQAGADVVVMLHPDYQYDPRLVGALAAMVASDVYEVA